jgi:coniferyl-aldehyde dehydrogenase
MTEDVSQRAVQMQAALELQRGAFLREGLASAKVRIDRLNRAIALVYDNQQKLLEAINSDFGHRSPHQTLLSDIFATLEGLKYNKKHVAKWMQPEKRRVGVPFNLFGVKAKVEYQPLGVVGIMGTWNFPVNTVFTPLAGVLAAGNRAMLKYSEVTPNTAELLNQLVGEFFEPDELCGFIGGPDVGAAFSALSLDHLIFTGSTDVGRHILKAAADNLTPVTLELGGKSPAIIGRSADLAESAVRVMTGKALNAGQVCLSPDYLLVAEEQLEAFVTYASEHVKSMFPAIIDNADYTSVVNRHHYQRLLAMIDDAQQRGADVRQINPANEDITQQSGTQKIPFTFVINPDDSMKVMQEEIFGPLLCVKSYQTIEECIAFINARPRPLGLYYFGNDEAEQSQVLRYTRSGGVTINDVFAHAGCENLPFGGIGPSGMGNYRGYDGFKTFSHARAVYKQSKINLQRLGGLIPPYGEKSDKALERVIKP